MALIDKGLNEEFIDDLGWASVDCWTEGQTNDAADFKLGILWLLEGAHKSDIGVIHRLIRDKLRG